MSEMDELKKELLPERIFLVVIYVFVPVILSLMIYVIITLVNRDDWVGAIMGGVMTIFLLALCYKMHKSIKNFMQRIYDLVSAEDEEYETNAGENSSPEKGADNGRDA